MGNRGTAVILIVSILSSLMFISSWAAAPGDVIINEIAWMGTQASAYDEWIELYNTTAMPIDIQKWSIYGADTSVCLNFSDADEHTMWIIPAYGYLIYANHLYDVKDSNGNGMVDICDPTIGMNNTAPGRLILYDGQDGTGNVIDVVNQDPPIDWFAGDAPTKKTMERKIPFASGEDSSNWDSNDPSIAANGFDATMTPLKATPGARNSVTNSPPIANAGLNQTALHGYEVQLDGSASSDPDGDPLSYTWSFTSRPIGSTSFFSDPIAVNPTFIPDIDGVYRVELIVGDDYGGSNVAQVIIDVLSPPAADFAYSPDQPTIWDPLWFTDQSSDPDGVVVAWSWNFGDGEVSSEQNPSHRYALPGRYTCTLEVIDDDELTHSFACGITILLGAGDVDGDGIINLLDIRICLQIVTGVISGTAAQRTAADVDGDGDVDLADAQLLAEYVIGIEGSLGGS